MRSIGLHLRVYTTLTDVAVRAQALGIQTFQCFFLNQATKTYLMLSNADKESFKHMRVAFKELFLHAVYWINPCSKNVYGTKRIMKRELSLARELGFTHYVLHPGSTHEWTTKQDGMQVLVDVLQEMFTLYPDITCVLENTAHGGRSVGSDMRDFLYIRQRLEQKIPLRFCVDTAHAYVYGYDITNVEGRANFLALVNETMGYDNVCLLHLNDTRQHLGHKKDKHDMLGEGLLGEVVLRRFVENKELAHASLIAEIPQGTLQQERTCIETITSWIQ